MKKLILILTSFAILAGNQGNSFSQDGNPVSSSLEKILSIGRKAKPAQRELFFHQQRAYPNKTVTSSQRENAIREEGMLMAKSSSRAVLLSAQPEWRCIGPYTIGGRVRTAVHHPTIEGTVYIGAAAGGIWKTTDGGDSWMPLFDRENSIAFGAIAIDPNNPDVLYAATGEQSNNVDSYLGSGVYKSIDGGQSWKIVGLSTVGSFCKIYVHPKNSNLIYAGAMKSGQGLWKSTDAGATWTKMLDKTISDVSINPNDPEELVVGVYGEGVYITYNGGQDWIQMNSGFKTGVGRVSVQYAPSNPDVLYCLMENNDTDTGNNYGNIYKTLNKGAQWTLVNKGDIRFFGTNNQGFYDNYISVNPKNENIVLAGGVPLWETTNGGTSWWITNALSPFGEIHVDQHCAAWSPINSNIVYVGNDGGMYKSTNSGNNWTDINNNLEITQFYAMMIDLSRANRNYGGTQDNGTVSNFTNEDSWEGVIGGDGFRVVSHPKKPNLIYGEFPFGELWRYDVSSLNFKQIVRGINAADTGLWNSPLTINPTDDYNLLHGRGSIYATYDRGDNWEVLPNTSSPSGTKYTVIEFSESSADIIWAARNNGDVLVTPNFGDTWGLASDKSGMPGRFVTDITTSRKDDNTAWVSFSGYGEGHIYKTVDLGKTWINISRDFPNVPVNSIAIHPDNENFIFAGTDIGVYATFDGGNSWLPYGHGLPRSPVADIAFHTNRVVLPNLVLRAATHGRSVWEVTVADDAVTEAEIINPAGGEKYIGSTRHSINWYGFELPVKVESSLDDGFSWTTVSESVNSNSLEWVIPDRKTFNARIKVSSLANTAQVKMTNEFTINQRQKGSVLSSATQNYIPYALAYDGKGCLWVSDFYSSKIHRVDTINYSIQKTISFPGDTLFSDISLDPATGTLYLHSLNSTEGAPGGHIIIADTNGNIKKRFISPATAYPIGMEFIDGKIIAGDRDAKRMLWSIDPTTGEVISQVKNPCQDRLGPRGLSYDGSRYMFQVCTNFPSDGGPLSNAYMIKFDKSQMDKELERFTLEDYEGLINARGVAFNPNDKTFWISDFISTNGSIYKIAGFETVVGVDDEISETATASLSVYPNPVSDLGIVTCKAGKALSNARIEVFDILGNLAMVLYDGSIGSGGSIMRNIYAGSLPTGIYNVVLSAGNLPPVSARMIIVK